MSLFYLTAFVTQTEVALFGCTCGDEFMSKVYIDITIMKQQCKLVNQ